MGEVYKARDTRLDRVVALKILPAEFAADPERRARFAREAKTISQLNHPHICVLHDIGEAALPSAERPAPSAQYLVMEYLEGETLTARLRKGPLLLPDALAFGSQIADALAAAHARGIVHRDLKPSNVMVARGRSPASRVVKLLDFGLAKLKPDGASEATATVTLSVAGEPATTPGGVLGTVPYMAPEQLDGGEADARSDVFAFGALLYEMITGRRAFEVANPASVAAAILEREPPPLSALARVTPPALERLVTKCLAKDPAARWQSATDLADELRWLGSGAGTAGGAAAARSAREAARGWPRTALAIMGMATLATAAWLGLKSATDGFLDTGLGLSSAPRPLTTLPGIEKDPAISPDGNLVAFVWNGGGDGRFHVYVKPVKGGERVQITRASADDARPVWSADGAHIAFLRRVDSRHEIWRARFPSGDARRFHTLQRTDDFPLTGLDWSPDGRYLAVPDVVPDDTRWAIFLLDAETGDTTQVSFPPTDAALGDLLPVFSPDGREVAFTRGLSVGGRTSALYCQAIADGRPTGEPQLLTPGPEGPVLDLDWSSDGMELFYIRFADEYAVERSANLRTVPRAGSREARAIVQAQRARTLSVDRGGARLVYATFSGGFDIWRMSGPAATTIVEAAPFIRSTRNDGSPRYSPDGSHVAFMSGRSGRNLPWLANADGTEARLLTDEVFADSHSTVYWPQWSPRKEAVAFVACNPQCDLFVIGLHDERPSAITTDGVDKTAPLWSFDGEWIYFNRPPADPSVPRKGVWALWRVPSSGGVSEQVTDFGQLPLGVDERHVYFHRAPTPFDRGQVWRVAYDGGEPTLVMDAKVYALEWTVWRQSLVYVNRFRADGPAIEAFDIVSGKSTTIGRLDDESFPRVGSFLEEIGFSGLAVSPDGRWILFGKQTSSDADLMAIDMVRNGPE